MENVDPYLQAKATIERIKMRQASCHKSVSEMSLILQDIKSKMDFLTTLPKAA
ncbi:MAG: hypothetical protein IM631_13010 [Cytophagales bacterium]|jgi:hypothetical protein|nr:hypothetical protein [Cytophagales bacterium]MCA6372292.1 hypothetical protein [Cytophagales bacterium]MCA6382437.1 hypothetical protein [Cytophagales bacterium]